MQSSEALVKDAKSVISNESLEYGINILQGTQNESKSSKKTLKDVVTEDEFEKRLLAELLSNLQEVARQIYSLRNKVPHAMEILLAKLNKVCIFRVPKYLSYSEAAFDSKEAYYRAIGYQEKDGNLESVGWLTQHMKLYAALIQTGVYVALQALIEVLQVSYILEFKGACSDPEVSSSYWFSSDPN
ncbi:hypothetical protein L1887_04000 [Cichorium endivia]|nr:hypothetical protein L1887_04000 [Cichorium endivia]